ncbi:hypothetical protein Q3G72_013306 [Acer saccharum]|nr:hypothetical protein Q3G72_013306 [Acer saccharum]
MEESVTGDGEKSDQVKNKDKLASKGEKLMRTSEPEPVQPEIIDRLNDTAECPWIFKRSEEEAKEFIWQRDMVRELGVLRKVTQRFINKKRDQLRLTSMQRGTWSWR